MNIATKARPQNRALRQDMLNSMKTYHKIDGAKNGTPGDEVVLAPGIGSENDLKASMGKLADFLSTKSDIEFRPPAPGVERSDHRKKVAKKAAAWVKSSAKTALEAAVAGIGDPALQALAQAGLDTSDKKFFTAPSSSSGRYHPADEINEGGLALHTCRDVALAEHLGDFYGISEKERDIVKTALILHDTWKGGDPWKKYAPDHGDLAAEHISSLPGGNTEDGKVVQRLVANHMGQWNKNGLKERDPRHPADNLEQIVSYADYLASQDNIYVAVPGAKGN